MKRFAQGKPLFPVRDYSRALQNSLTWLGDRHLLATPVPARSDEPRSKQFTAESPPVSFRMR